ncbi:dTDP-4-dehydrorhamnose 3,5-epimerase [Bosea sp. BIWAKO-01]|uniref:dTDP-4-dehydrorhamnose 3,5-epimerase n=1 Tax=Bosea sp. BIWAKO-01 TaxID=506668 RepID=UPI00085318F3|nr:dTDP-4-dehydrorhamnose 3,5-epimerase [Bosea sp. BIWAKO-01]GAU81560.1 dTDP-4-dehydrorhamnose 3,5-epimerase [Bosea sp. BIWAKO-01]
MSNFTFAPLAIPGPVLVRPRRFGDDRGYFMETYSRDSFAAAGIAPDFVQDNQSLSAQVGTVRGLHYQTAPAAQAKLVRVLKGAIFDVAVDLRRGSPHYGRWCGTLLDADGAEQLFVPCGFAHGFCTLEPGTEVAYKVDAPYAPQSEGGLFWADPELAIDWPVVAGAATLSEKDAKLPGFAGFASPFVYEGA